MSAPKLAFFLGITLVALLTFTKGVPRHQNTATATTAPAIFQKMMPVAYQGAALRRYAEVDHSIAQRAPCVINRFRLKLLDDGQARKSFVEFSRRGLEFVAQRGDFGA